MTEKVLDAERADLLQSLRRHREFLRHTVRDLTDEQAAQRPTRSELSLGGLIKHVATTEENWMRFAAGGSLAGNDNWDPDAWANGFRMLPDETLAGLLARYDAVARRSDELVATLDLNTDHELPPAPWFPPGERWTVRRVVLHVIAETSQHAGHADIIRETIDGAKTMG